MHIFFSEEVLYFINTVSQLVIAISAVVAIINDSKELEVVSGISIKMFNTAQRVYFGSYWW